MGASVNNEWDDDQHDDPLGNGTASDDPWEDSGPLVDNGIDPLDPLGTPTTTTSTSAHSLEARRTPRFHLPRIPRWSVIGIGIVLVGAFLGPRIFSGGDEPDWDQLTRSVVLLFSPDCGWTGSGTVVLEGGHVLTNAHVAMNEAGKPCSLEVYAAKSPEVDPEWIANAVAVEEAVDLVHDLAVIQLVDNRGHSTTAEGRPAIQIHSHKLDLGTQLKVLGYPGMGGTKITITPGEQSGWWTGSGGDQTGDFYKTSAKMGPGISGGAAFSVLTGEFVGVPTAGSIVEGGDVLGLIRPNQYIIPLLDRARRADN
ncbi:MAG: hypothetical protein CMM60_11575 [Rhodospirillaceae bacterium]|jgi:S1-C subfamily serine protease|nr:hypothetical protein [Rhodospirillaceae bacterium]|tara:strand:- start:1912 stop:2844 length:933 start_codon:yes stop_codon:yes gene_type:complete